MDMKSVLEEVALEGLDGITLNALWLRLATRPDNSPGPLDDFVREYIWKNLVCCREIEFFKLPKPRPELVITDFNDNVYQCRCVLNDYPEDIYSIERVDEDGILGSCDHYKTRVSIMDEIRGEDDQALLTVVEANDKWGQQLVIVASQVCRFQVLLGANHLISGVGSEVYCLLERVGRSRTNGDITLPMPSGLGVINKNLKGSNVFTIVKYLCRRGLMRKQAFNIRFTSTGRNYHVRLLHLSRFYQETRANSLQLLDRLCITLQEAPKQRLSRKDLREKANVLDKDIKKHWFIISKFINKDMLYYREIYPAAKEEDWKAKNGSEKRITVYTLIESFSIGRRKELEEEDDDEDVDEKEMEDTDIKTDENLLQPEMGPFYEMTYPRSLLYAIEKAGHKGITVNGLSRLFGLHKKSLMRALQGLIHNKIIASVSSESKTNTAQVLVSAKYADEERIKVVKTKPKRRKSFEYKETSDQDEGDDSMIQDLPSGSKSGGENLIEDDLEEDEEMDMMKVEMDEARLDKTLAELELTWTIERKAKPIEMSAKLYKLMIPKKKKRRQLIVRYLEKNRVCTSSYELRKKVLDWEASHGIKESMCRKSFVRILEELYTEGKICHLIVNCEQQVASQTHTLLAAHDITVSDKAVKDAILLFYTTKYKFFVSLNKNKELRYQKLNDMIKVPEDKPFSYADTLTRLSHVKEENIKLFKSPLPQTPPAKSIERIAKIRKARELHKFMFYLLYDYPEEARLVKQKAGAVGLDASLLQSNESTELPVYMDVQDWRRHVPPLKIHNTKFFNSSNVDGKCMLGDLVMTMPIEVICKIVQFDWEVRGLSEIRQDPEKNLRLVYSIPAVTLKDLRWKRTYLRKIIQAFNTLCRMGLGSFLPSAGLRHIEYTVFYLHKKAMLLDTMKSLPGHLKTRVPEPGTEFPRLHFEFKNMNDVEVYWKEAQLICMSTPLGQLDPDDDPGFYGEVTLSEATRPRAIDKIKEDNWLPGDRRGVAGFDSSMFMHRMRNWDFKKMIHKSGNEPDVMPQEGVIPRPSGRRAKRSASTTKPATTAKKAVKRARANLTTKPRAPRKRKRASVENGEKKEEGEKKKGGKTKRMKLVLDDEDKKAKMEMARLRCLFSPLENGIFLIIHVASYIMCPKDLHIKLQAPDVRTVFKSLAPTAAKDKTTHAIKGKSARLIRDENFLSHMGIYLAKARYDMKLLEEFKDFKCSQSPKHRAAMFEFFSSLVKKLHIKFSSPEQILPYKFPVTTSEFHQQYEYKLALDMKNVRELAVPKARFDVTDPYDVRASVLWDFILGWMHSNRNICNILVYHILCQYSEAAVNRTQTCLKSSRIMYMHKKYKYVRGHRTLARTDQVVSNLILSKRHRERLMSHYPADLFQNALKQMGLWEKQLEKSHHHGSQVSHEGADKDKDKSAMSKSIAPTSEGDTADVNEDEGENQADDPFVLLDTAELHGGSLITILPLMALDLLDIDVAIPDSMVTLSKEGTELLTLKKAGRKRKVKDATLDGSMEDSNDDDEDLGSRFPDKDNRKRLRIQAGKKRQRGNAQSSNHDEDPDKKNVGDGNEGETESQPAENKIMDFGENVKVSFNQEKAHCGDVLLDFTMSFASGTLLALARTRMLADIDLLKTQVNVQRFFIVQPLVMKFALKECYVNENEGNPQSHSDAANSVVMEPGEADNRDKSKECLLEGSSSKHSSSSSVYGSHSSNTPSSSEAGKSEKAECENVKVKNCLSAFYKPRLYDEIMSRLERRLPVNFAECDVNQELDSISKEGSADCGWLEQGRSLFSMIDSSGAHGLTEPELEDKVDRPLFSFQHVLNKLCHLNAAFLEGMKILRRSSRVNDAINTIYTFLEVAVWKVRTSRDLTVQLEARIFLPRIHLPWTIKTMVYSLRRCRRR